MTEQTAARQPILRVRALECANIYGRVPAGWLMNQLDMAGSLEAERIARGEVATVAVNACQFAAPVLLGDVVDFYVERLRIGQKSITLKIIAQALRVDGSHVNITEVIVTFVALNRDGKSRLLDEA
ncbi:acyl-CoA thioesterase [Neisseriaceae bacterium TC5R-5]|nr:acyl-CoA thioesterase [Neisseriaceae bacterium TC5R-5]